MRISDWSSDVCSSDLKGALDAGANDAALRPLLARAYAMQGEGARALETLKSGPVIPEMLGEAAWVAGDVHLANGALAAAREAYDRAVHELPLSPALWVDVARFREANRSEERRVGKECVSPCRSRGAPDLKKKTKQKKT